MNHPSQINSRQRVQKWKKLCWIINIYTIFVTFSPYSDCLGVQDENKISFSEIWAYLNNCVNEGMFFTGLLCYVSFTADHNKWKHHLLQWLESNYLISIFKIQYLKSVE